MPREEAKDKSLAERLVELGLSELPKAVVLRPAILLSPQIPKPLHGLAPRRVLGAKWWNATRRKAYESTNYHCLACGVSRYAALYHKWMEAHELYEIDYLLGRSEYIETVPLCHSCHNFIHCGRLERLVELGKTSVAKYRDIMFHGFRVLRAAGLRKEPPTDTGLAADWKDWRLVVFGKEYKSLFKNEREWEEYHKKLHEED